MKRLLAVLIAATSLSACSTTGTGSGITPTTLQNALVAGCGIVVDTTTVLGLISAGNATLTSIDAIVNAVCSAYTKVAAPVASTKFGVRMRMVAPIAVTIGGIVVPITGVKQI